MKVYAASQLDEEDAQLDQLLGLLTKLKTVTTDQPATGAIDQPATGQPANGRRLRLAEGRHSPSVPTKV